MQMTASKLSYSYLLYQSEKLTFPYKGFLSIQEAFIEYQLSELTSLRTQVIKLTPYQRIEVSQGKVFFFLKYCLLVKIRPISGPSTLVSHQLGRFFPLQAF